MTDIPGIHSRDKDERWLAFETLLAWAEATVRQGARLESARSRWRRPSGATSTDELRVEARDRKFACHTFNTERHLFIDTAWKLIEHRKWVGKLGLLNNDAFRELDTFENDVNTLKDIQEHAIEYFESGADHIDRWVHQLEGGTSSTMVEIGMYLPYVAIAEMAERLCKILYEIGSSTAEEIG